jgi:hypothetical protein
MGLFSNDGGASEPVYEDSLAGKEPGGRYPIVTGPAEADERFSMRLFNLSPAGVGLLELTY